MTSPRGRGSSRVRTPALIRDYLAGQAGPDGAWPGDTDAEKAVRPTQGDYTARIHQRVKAYIRLHAPGRSHHHYPRAHSFKSTVNLLLRLGLLERTGVTAEPQDRGAGQGGTAAGFNPRAWVRLTAGSLTDSRWDDPMGEVAVRRERGTVSVPAPELAADDVEAFIDELVANHITVGSGAHADVVWKETGSSAISGGTRYTRGRQHAIDLFRRTMRRKIADNDPTGTIPIVVAYLQARRAAPAPEPVVRQRRSRAAPTQNGHQAPRRPRGRPEVPAPAPGLETEVEARRQELLARAQELGGVDSLTGEIAGQPGTLEEYQQLFDEAVALAAQVRQVFSRTAATRLTEGINLMRKSCAALSRPNPTLQMRIGRLRSCQSSARVLAEGLRGEFGATQ